MRLTSIAVLTLLGYVCPGPLTAQARRVDPGLELSSGIGVSNQGGALLAALGLHTRKGDFVVRGAAADEFTILGAPETSSWDLGFLYGWTIRGDVTWLRVAAGAAVAHTTRTGAPIECFILCAYERLRSEALGVALQADAVWAFSRFLGVGFGAFADLNGDNSFGGITLGVHLGQVR